MKFIREGYNLPLTVSIGVATAKAGSLTYKVFGDALTLGANLTHQVFGGKTDFGFGSEYWLGNVFALRGRYNLLSTNDRLTNNESTHRLSGVSDTLSKFAAGFGLRFLGYQLDYAFVPYAELGETQRISFLARF